MRRCDKDVCHVCDAEFNWFIDLYHHVEAEHADPDEEYWNEEARIARLNMPIAVHWDIDCSKPTNRSREHLTPLQMVGAALNRTSTRRSQPTTRGGHGDVEPEVIG